jgi:lysophospholipase L1-like esterase
MRALLIALIVGALMALVAIQSNAPAPVVFYGDSIIEGWDVSAFGGRNAGHAGEVSEQVLNRLLDDAAVPSGSGGAYVVLVGINDLDWGISDQTYRDNVATMIAALYTNGRPVYLCSLLPVGDRWARLRPRIIETNAWLRTFADEHERVVYVDFYAAFDGAAADAYFPDGLHPNAAGYAVMNGVLANAVNSA